MIRTSPFLFSFFWQFVSGLTNRSFLSQLVVHLLRHVICSSQQWIVFHFAFASSTIAPIFFYGVEKTSSRYRIRRGCDASATVHFGHSNDDDDQWRNPKPATGIEFRRTDSGDFGPKIGQEHAPIGRPIRMRQDANPQHFGPAWIVSSRVGRERGRVKSAHQFAQETLEGDGQRGNKPARLGLVQRPKGSRHQGDRPDAPAGSQIHRPDAGNFQFRRFQRMARQFPPNPQYCKFFNDFVSYTSL